MMRAALLALLISTAAHADAPSPWAVGVSDARKADAKRALDEGNALFLKKEYSAALAQYQTAIAAWDHPAIRFNIVRCLIQLDRPVEAADNLKLALAYGAAPLEEAVYAEALAYEKLLANQIGELVITCGDGMKVTVDGQAIAPCPTTETRRVKPGGHQIVGEKPGFLTRTFEVVIVGGTQQTVDVKLERLGRAGHVEHRWSQWIPWVVFGSGFAVIGGGALLDLSAAADMDSYDRSVKQQCPMRSCDESMLPTDLRDKAEMKSNIAVGVMVLGAATVAAGGVMLYMNRGRTVYPEVAPVRAGATIGVSGRF
jgi:tetratricopeptide (TPR) repeat protein